MSLPKPRLDDRTYSQLVAEALARIPHLAAGWSDHNPADPGITLVELLAWLTEMLLYRIDRLPPAYVRAFLELLNGSDWQPGSDLEADVGATLDHLRRRHRAVTARDYEELAEELARDWLNGRLELAGGSITFERVSPGARACCVSGRDLSASTEKQRKAEAPAHVSVILVPPAEGYDRPPIPSGSLLDSVRGGSDPEPWGLEKYRLLTTRLAVTAPVWAWVEIEAEVRGDANEKLSVVRGNVESALRRYLDPLEGGADGGGWPLGRPVYVSELYAFLETCEGVRSVERLRLASSCPAPGERDVVVDAIRHDRSPIGLALERHHLPWLHEIRVSPG